MADTAADHAPGKDDPRDSAPSAIHASGVSLPPPPNQSLGSWLTEVLKDRLAGGVYAPGAWIREAALRGEFGLSNGPVREALQNLVAAGVLERVQWRGVRVVELAGAEIVELFQLRLALHELGAELAARRAHGADIAHARALLDRIDRAITEHDIETMMPAGGALSRWVCEVSGNRQLLEAWDGLALKARMYIFVSLKNCAELDRVGGLWHTLVDAVANRSLDEARNAARQLTRRTLADLGLDGDC